MTASNLDSQWRRRAHRFGPRGRHPWPSLRQPLKAAQGLVLRGAVEAQGEGAYQVAGDAGQTYDVVDGTAPVATTNIACEVPGCGEHYWRNGRVPIFPVKFPAKPHSIELRGDAPILSQ